MSAVPCLSQCSISTDGKWEGWCWYPDRPDDRAIVEVFAGSRSIRAMRAARLRTEVRDLGMGDGYCGFQLPLPSKESLPGYTIVEVRERRFGRVIGRLVLGEDCAQSARERRLNAAAKALHAVNHELGLVSTEVPTRAVPFEELGALLSHLSSRPTRAASPLLDVLTACEQRMDVIPRAEFSCSAPTHVSIVIRTSHAGGNPTLTTLAAALREIALEMRQMGTEIILVDDGVETLAGLLPMRLRHLRLVRTMPAAPPGVGLNAAALTARGSWLAFARAPTLGTAHLLEATRAAATGNFYVEGSASDPQGTPPRYHRLQSLVLRSAFHDMGGFDPQLDEPDMWADMCDKARVLGQRIVRWKYPRDSATTLKVAKSNPSG